jgi:hypothetical protein
MVFAVEALIDTVGNVKVLQPISIPTARRALVVILDEPSLPIAETALLSEAALAEDWLRPEEDAAWSYLRSGATAA